MSTVEERFWAKVDKTGECWEWTASKNADGYGHFGIRAISRSLKAHRLSYEWANGDIPEGMMIDHMCHNRGCVRPAHLRLATPKQNNENRIGAMPNTYSGVRGVYWDITRSHWVASVQHNGKRFNVGRYDTVAAAEAAVIAKRNELFTHNDVDRKSGYVSGMMTTPSVHDAVKVFRHPSVEAA